MEQLFTSSFSSDFTSLAEQLKSGESPYFLLTRSDGEPAAQEVQKALSQLSEEPDVPCLGIGTSFLFKTVPVLELWHQGFRPCYSLAELVPALRQAGWQVCESTVAACCRGAVGTMRRGREKAMSQLYETVTEQTLASGPRQLKGTCLWALAQCGKRILDGSSPIEELAAAGQQLLNSLHRNHKKVCPTTWAGSLDFSFPEAGPRASTVVLMFTALRPWYLRRALRALREHWPQDPSVRLVVSQDGTEPATVSLVRSLAPQVEHWVFNDSIQIPMDDWLKGRAPYYRIAQHFASTLRRAFSEEEVERVIILEDDIEIGADFFGFMEICRRALSENSDLLTASAWNDNGHLPGNSPLEIHRTDCFPGLGWMLQRDIWEKLEPDWPLAYWDEWIREPHITEGRQCLRPGISRVRNFGRAGTGASTYFDRFIATNIALEKALPWSENEPLPLTRTAYRQELASRVARAQTAAELTLPLRGDTKIRYASETEFNQLAEKLGIVPGFRPLSPRTAFEGVVTVPQGGHWLFLIPESWEDSEPGT